MKNKKVVCSKARFFFAWLFAKFGSDTYAINSLKLCSESNKELKREVEENSRRIAELEEMFIKEKERSIRDSLTGLYNRHFLTETGSEIIANIRRARKSWAVIFIDVDKFKLVNDVYGHDVGDDILKGVTDALRQCSRKGDFLVRNGGDEFISIMSNVQQVRHVIALAERFRYAVEAEFAAPFDITLSIGCCFVESGSTTNLMDAITTADTALYKAKAAGRNCVRFCK